MGGLITIAKIACAEWLPSDYRISLLHNAAICSGKKGL